MKFFSAIVLTLGLIYFDPVQCMTEKQITNAIKLVRNVCQPKFKLTNAQIDNMHKGIFEDDKQQAATHYEKQYNITKNSKTASQCYMNCGMTSLKFMKNSKMDYEYATGQLKNLPESWQGPLAHALSDCKDTATASDKCDAAYQVAKCMYNSEPDHYILP